LYPIGAPDGKGVSFARIVGFAVEALLT